MKKSKWTQAHVEMLTQKAAAGSVRTQVFAEVAQQTNRKANSVRNYYYKYLAQEKAKFVPFPAGAVREILREIVLGTSRGESVRGICMRLAGGNRSKMLRIQNKYRSVLRTKPQAIENIKGELEKQGYLVKSPLLLPRQISMFEKSNVVTLLPRDDKKLSDTDINNLFMGLMRLVQKRAEDNAKNQIAMLKAEIERLKIDINAVVK